MNNLSEIEKEFLDWHKNTIEFKSVKAGFIAGSESKHVERAKLEFAIDELSKCLYPKGIGVKKKIKELENRLNSL